MRIVNEKISRAELSELAQASFGDMVKGVVDVGKELVAIDADLHSDLEAMLLAAGSQQEDLWGINLYPSEAEDFIEFDSLINIRPLQNNRSRGVNDPATRERIIAIVGRWFE